MKKVKKTFGVLVLFCCLLFVSGFVTGCASLQEALRVAEESQASAKAAGEELAKAEAALEVARTTYSDAMKSGDTSKIDATLAALKAAEEDRKAKGLDFEATKKYLQEAQEKLEAAKKTDMYLETVLGLAFGFLTGGGGGFLAGRGKKNKALVTAGSPR